MISHNSHYDNIEYKFVEVDGIRVFYREAGDPKSPIMLLLHGFPSSSHQYRNLIPKLTDKFRVIAPDLPGFGFTEVPQDRNYSYRFDSLAQTMKAFTEALGLNHYAMYVFDYGAPTGFRLALANPERITGLVSQNGNAYLEGLGDAWDPVRIYWKEPTLANRNKLRAGLLTLEATRWQYIEGVTDPQLIAPESYMLDALLMERDGNKEIQLDFLLDYINNLEQYPKFQAYFRSVKFPMLIIWGKNDPFFTPAGAGAFKKDNPKAIVELLDTGHFALETHADYIAKRIHDVIIT